MDGKKRRSTKEKKVKDPNAPKRPASAYLEYQNSCRESFRQQYPDDTYAEVLKKIGQSWQNLSDAEKAVRPPLPLPLHLLSPSLRSGARPLFRHTLHDTLLGASSSARPSSSRPLVVERALTPSLPLSLPSAPQPWQAMTAGKTAVYLEAKSEYEKTDPNNASPEEQEAVAIATEPKAKRPRKSEATADIAVDATPKEKKAKSAKKAASPPKAATPVRPLPLSSSPSFPSPTSPSSLWTPFPRHEHRSPTLPALHAHSPPRRRRRRARRRTTSRRPRRRRRRRPRRSSRPRRTRLPRPRRSERLSSSRRDLHSRARARARGRTSEEGGLAFL